MITEEDFNDYTLHFVIMHTDSWIFDIEKCVLCPEYALKILEIREMAFAKCGQEDPNALYIDELKQKVGIYLGGDKTKNETN